MARRVAHLDERTVFAKTVYAEARGESTEGQRWVAWVIKNRARMNRSYWGGGSIKDVCLHSGQFECWDGRKDIEIHEHQVYNNIRQLTDQIYDTSYDHDPTGGADHYNNPKKEGYPDWTKNCTILKKIGDHVFYKGP